MLKCSNELRILTTLNLWTIYLILKRKLVTAKVQRHYRHERDRPSELIFTIRKSMTEIYLPCHTIEFTRSSWTELHEAKSLTQHQVMHVGTSHCQTLLLI